MDPFEDAVQKGDAGSLRTLLAGHPELRTGIDRPIFGAAARFAVSLHPCSLLFLNNPYGIGFTLWPRPCSSMSLGEPVCASTVGAITISVISTSVIFTGELYDPADGQAIVGGGAVGLGQT